MEVSVAEVEPFCSADSSVKGEEEEVVELLVPNLGGDRDEGK